MTVTVLIVCLSRTGL